MGGRGASSTRAKKFLDNIRNSGKSRNEIEDAVNKFASDNNIDAEKLLKKLSVNPTTLAIENETRNTAKRLADEIAKRDGITYTEAMKKAVAQINDNSIKEIRQLQKNLSSAKANESRTYKEYMKYSGGVLMAQTEAVAERERAKRDKAWDKYLKAKIKRSNIEIDINKKVREYRGVGRATPQDRKMYTAEDMPF